MTKAQHISRIAMHGPWIILISWLIMNGFILSQYGIVTHLEAAPYLSVAKDLIAKGHYPSGNFLFYSVEIWLDAFCLRTGTGLWLVVAIQLLLNGISVCLFYKIIKKFTGRKNIAYWFTLAFLCMYYYQLYNVHLYTESIYFSLSIILAYCVFSMETLRVKNMLIILCLLFVLGLTRPTGIFFFPALYLFITLKFFRKKAIAILGISTVIAAVGFYYLVNFAIGSGGALNFLQPYLNEQVICGIAGIENAHDLKVPGNVNSIGGLWYIITHYPGLFWPLAAKRMIAFFGMYRSYYSLAHNVFICGYFYCCYLLVIGAIKKIFRYLPAEAAFILCVILLLTVTVILSCDEWHNRFIFGIMPFLLLMASVFFRKNAGPA